MEFIQKALICCFAFAFLTMGDAKVRLSKIKERKCWTTRNKCIGKCGNDGHCKNICSVELMKCLFMAVSPMDRKSLL
ncbi:hypothetical protein ScPMuIL_017005 [Solemya velum]